MNRQRRLAAWMGAILGVLCALLFAAEANAEDYGKLTEEFHHTYPLGAGGRVELDNINGAVHITAWDKDEVKVDAVKYANTKERMDEAEIEFRDLGRIAVTVGPGSFTGLRVGISAARGIALAARKPAIGLTTFAGLAAPHIAEDDTAPVVVAIDARHGHVYMQVFGPGGRTLLTPRIAPLREAVRAATIGPAVQRYLTGPLPERHGA